MKTRYANRAVQRWGGCGWGLLLPSLGGRRGSVLIGIVVTMAIFSVLATGMMHFVSTSAVSEVGGYAADRASYLAESGYRYVAGQFKTPAKGEFAKNETLEALHGNTYKLRDGDGEFTLGIYPYFYMVDTDTNAGSTSLAVRFPGAIPDGYAIPASGGLAILGNDSVYDHYGYTSVSHVGSKHTFSLTSGLDEAEPEFTIVVPVLYPSSAQTFSNGGNLTVANAANQFPERLGYFEIDTAGDENVYYYQERDGNELKDIRILSNPSQAFTKSVDTTTKVVMHTSAFITSTGTFEDTSKAFSRIAVLGAQAGAFSDNAANPSGGGFEEQGNDPVTFEQNWNVEGDEASIKSGGPAGGEGAVNIKGNSVVISLDWQNSVAIPDFDQIWSGAGGLLDYNIQVKVAVEDQGSKGDHYLLGLSFRYTDDNNFYGMSFFRSIGKDPNPALNPAWLNALPASFDAIIDTYPYLVFWKKQAGNYVLIDYKKLADISATLIDSDQLYDWSTIVVEVDEQFSGGNDSRENHITASVSGPVAYPRNTIDWDATHIDVPWTTNGTGAIVDSTFVSDNFDILKPDEIGIHGYYDSTAANDQFFDDFSMQLPDYGGGGGGGIPGQ